MTKLSAYSSVIVALLILLTPLAHGQEKSVVVPAPPPPPPATMREMAAYECLDKYASLNSVLKSSPIEIGMAAVKNCDAFVRAVIDERNLFTSRSSPKPGSGTDTQALKESEEVWIKTTYLRHAALKVVSRRAERRIDKGGL